LFFLGLSGKPAIILAALPDTSVFLREGVLDKTFLDIMPFSSLFVARNYEESGSMEGSAGKLISGALLLFLCFDIARRAGGGVGGGLLVLVLAIFKLNGDAEQKLFSIGALLFLDLALTRAGKENFFNALAAGFAGSIALLVRSDALPLIALYAARELFFTSGALKARFARSGAIVLAVLLMLAPWSVFTSKILGYPLLFEYKRAECNLVAAGLGSIYTIEGDYRGIAGLNIDDNVFVWLAGQVAAHPARLAGAFFIRLWHVFKINPLLITGAAAAFVFSKSRKLPALVLAFALTYLLSHAALPIEPRYFYPFWLMLLPLLGLFIRGQCGKQEPHPFFDPLLKVLLTCAFITAAWTSGITLRGAVRGKTPDDLEGVLLAGPLQDSRLHIYGLNRAIFRGAGDTARGLLERAAAAGAPGARLTLSVLLSTSAPVETLGWPVTLFEHGVKLFKELEAGKKGAAALTYKKTEEKWRREKCLARGEPLGLDSEIAGELARRDNSLVERYLLKSLVFWLEEERIILADRLAGLIPANASLYIFKAELLVKNNKHELAFKAAKEGLALGVKDGDMIRCVSVFTAAGHRLEAIRILKDLALYPGSPGIAASAVSPSVAVGRLDLAYDFLLRAGGGSAGGAEAKTKCAVLVSAASLPGQKDIFSRTALLEFSAGKFQDTFSTVACALKDPQSPDELFSLGLLLQDAGRPEMAAELFESLALRYPEKKEFLYSSGVARALAGDYLRASTTLERYQREAGDSVRAKSALAFVRTRLK